MRWTCSPRSSASIRREVRRANFIADDAFPYTTASHATYDCGDYERALDLALEAAGYEALREEQRRRRSEGSRAPARDRHQLLRRGDERGRRGGIRRRRDHPGRQGDRPHRLVLARPGARDDVRHDRRREARPPVGVGDRRQGRYRSGSAGHRHVRLEVDADRRHGRRPGRAGGRGARPQPGRRPARGEPGRRRARSRHGTLPRRRRAHARLLVGRAGGTVAGRRPARGVARRAGLQGREPDLPVRRARRRRRGGHGDRRRRVGATRRRRRCRRDHQPAHRGRPGAGWGRDRRRAGAVRGGPLRRGGESADGQLPRVLLPVRVRAALVRARVDGDPDPGQPPRRQGDRRVRDDRSDACGTERGRRRAGARSGCVTSTCLQTASASGARSRRSAAS